jgi:uncharacterized protein
MVIFRIWSTTRTLAWSIDMCGAPAEGARPWICEWTGRGPGVQLTSAIRISRPAPEVLDALLDAGMVAACLPGGRLIGEVDEGTYAGELKLRIGPVDAVYAGTVHLDAADRAAGTARLRASGQERGGHGSADARVTLRVEPQGASTRVLISAELTVHGAAAQYAAGALGDAGQRLVEQFAGNVERLLASQGAPGGGPGWTATPGAGRAAGARADRRARALAALAALLAAGAVAGALAAWAARRHRQQQHRQQHGPYRQHRQQHGPSAPQQGPHPRGPGPPADGPDPSPYLWPEGAPRG